MSQHVKSEVCAELWELGKTASSARTDLDELHLTMIISTLLLHC